MATNSRNIIFKNMILKTGLNGDDNWDNLDEDEDKEGEDDTEDLGAENWGNALEGDDDDDDDFAN